MASSLNMGSPHPFPWPKVNGFHTRSSMEEMVQHLKANKVWNVTEKLDGSNVCLSTQGWMASRNNIICTRDIPKTVFQGVHLKNVNLLFSKLDALKNLLQKNFFKGKELEVLLYGELILHGTGMTKYDLYHYKERKLLPGEIYCFAIGLILPEGTDLPLIFENGFPHQGAHQLCHIIPMSFYLSQLLQKTHIDHTPLLFSGALSDLVEIEYLENKIFQRKVEGFVLSGAKGEGFIKWKYIECPNDSLEKHFEDMMDLAGDSIATKCVTMLQELCAIGKKFITNLEDFRYKDMLKIYFQTEGEQFLQLLDKAKCEGLISFRLALEKETERVFRYIKDYLKETCLLDPLFCHQLRNQISFELKEYYKKMTNFVMYLNF
jgi:hypothetical protein